MSEERRKILDMVGTGRISPEQGAALLNLVAAPDEGETERAEDRLPDTAVEGRAAANERRPFPLWVYPLGAGLIVLVIGATIVSTMYQRHRVNVWTWLCGWIPLVVGLLVVTLAAWARTAPWIHIRVRDHAQHIALSLPLPLGLTAAVIRVAQPFVPQLRDTAVDEAILALRDGMRGNKDIIIDVQDDEDGESVNIDFGGRQ